jgi:hypothetical protein
MDGCAASSRVTCTHRSVLASSCATFSEIPRHFCWGMSNGRRLPRSPRDIRRTANGSNRQTFRGSESPGPWPRLQSLLSPGRCVAGGNGRSKAGGIAGMQQVQCRSHRRRLDAGFFARRELHCRFRKCGPVPSRWLRRSFQLCRRSVALTAGDHSDRMANLSESAPPSSQ